MFRRWLRSTIINQVDENLNASIQLGDIHGNIFTGLTIDSVVFATQRGPLIKSKRIMIRYDIFQLPYKYLRLNEITFHNAELFLQRSASGQWNFSNLLKDTTASKESPFKDWTLILSNFRLNDCRIVVYDSTIAEQSEKNRFSFTHINLKQINLALSAALSDNEKKVSINQFSFENSLGEFSLNNLSGDVTLTPNHFSIENLSIQTPRSAIQISASLDSLDVLKKFSFLDLASKPMRVNLSAPKIDMRDLQTFLPSLDILGSKASLFLTADGSLHALSVNDLQLDTPESEIAFKGEIRDIEKGSDLVIRVYTEKCKINPRELPQILPGITLPDFSNVGEVSFKKLIFDGQPRVFKSQIEMTSASGDVEGVIKLDFTHEQMQYDAQLTTKSIDLRKILNKENLFSELNVRAEIKGSGIHPGSMVTSAKITADSSRYSRYFFNRLQVTASADNNNIALELNSSMGNSSLATTARWGFVRDSITSFNLIGDAASIDIARILNNDSLNSNLSFHVEAQGDGIDINKSSGTVFLLMNQSQFQNISIEKDTITLDIDQKNLRTKNITLKTKYADLVVNGSYDIQRFMDFITMSNDSVRRGIDLLAMKKDSVGNHQNHRERTNRYVSHIKQQETYDTSRFMDVKYSLSLKKPELIAKYFGVQSFLMRGTYEGSVSGGLKSMNLNGNLRFSDFYIVDTSFSYLGAGLSLRYSITDLSPIQFINQLHVDINLSAQDIELNGPHFKNTTMRLQFADKKARISFRGLYDTSLSLTMDSDVRLVDTSYSIEISRLNLDYLGSVWKNASPVRAQVFRDRVLLNDCELAKDNMLVRIDAAKIFGGTNDLNLVAKNLQLSEVEFLITANKAALDGLSFNGVSSLEVHVQGSDANPVMSLYIALDSISYKNFFIGNLTAEGTYSNQRLEVFSEMYYQRGKEEPKQIMFVSGILPIDLSFTRGAERILKKSASLSVRMNDFPLAILEKFIGLFNQLEGTANADITMTGTEENFQYSGALTIDKAKGLFKLNNIPYILSARIEPQQNSIFIREFSIQNEQQDYPDGKLVTTGKIDLKNFNIDDFSLMMKGRLKVLRTASRMATKVIYGDLYVSTGDEGLTYTGSLHASRFIGKLHLTRGNLILPLEKGTAGAEKNVDISYLVVDDTTKVKSSSLSAGILKKRKSVLGRTIEDENGSVQRSRSILDGLAYDLTLSTDGPVRITMPFNSLTQEELNAQLVVDQLKVNNWGGHGKFEGEVKLAGDSYYLFFGKKFQASGSLLFTGSPLDPELNLTAVYIDYHLNQETKENRKIYVILNITGTKARPTVSFDIRQDAIDGTRLTLGDVQSDAISFIMTGSFTNELTSSEKGKLLDKAQGLSSTLASSLLSSAVSGFLQNAGLGAVVNRVEVSGITSTDPRLKLTTEIGRAVITYDGKITDLGSSDIKIEIPISVGFANFILEISRRTSNTTIEGGITPQESSIYEAKILYRITF